MTRERSYQSIILKKTPYNEADEIITVLSLEAGKMRFLAKSVRLSKSKLQSSLQSLFVANIKITASRSGFLSKVIGSEVLETFMHLRQDLACVKSALPAMELVLKFLPDEQPYAGIFKLTRVFLHVLDQQGPKPETLLLAYKIKFLEFIGLGLSYPAKINNAGLYFSNSAGGFTTESGREGIKTSEAVLEDWLFLKGASFKELVREPENFLELKHLVNNFLEYHLERDLKAEKSLKGVV